MRPRLLDLFSGAGGCARGYQRAGLYVVGVDIKPQPRYAGDEFIQGDALEVLRTLVAGGTVGGYRLPDFVAIHASPPCQAWTHARLIGHRGRDDHPRLIEPIRELLVAAGLPYVIENVKGAGRELRYPVMLCGSMFGLSIERHRFFECSFPVMAPRCQHGNFGDRKFAGTPRHDGSRPLSRIVNPMASGCGHEEFAEAMEIDWMPASGFRPTNELREAIPPVYTEHVGGFLMAEINAKVAA